MHDLNNPRSIFTGFRSPSEILCSRSTDHPTANHNSLSKYSNPSIPVLDIESENTRLHPAWTSTTLVTHPGELPPTSAPLVQPPLRDSRSPAPKRKRSDTIPRVSNYSPIPGNPPPLKRRRNHTRAWHNLDHIHLRNLHDRRGPPSPLFFSSTRNKPQRPPLPARFSSWEAGARMLSKAQGEDSGIKTVTLARGTFDGLSPRASTGTPLDRSPSERSSIPPDGSERNDPLHLLRSVGILEFLELDTRPTFILDLSGTYNYGPGALRPIFRNKAFEREADLDIRTLGADVLSMSLSRFKAWALSGVVQGESLHVGVPPIEHASFTWSCITVRKSLRVICGTKAAIISSSTTPGSDVPTSPPKLPISDDSGPTPYEGASSASSLALRGGREPQDYFSSATLDNESLPDAVAEVSVSFVAERSIPHTPSVPSPNSNPRNEPLSRIDHPSYSNEVTSPENMGGFFDWTRLPISDDLPRHIHFARSIDWAATSLGPIEYWSSHLRQMCNLIMASPHPAAMYWGDDLIAIYNEPYVSLAGQKHPGLMGNSYKVAWAEIWDAVEKPFSEAWLTGQATMKDNDCLFIMRSGFLEESYFSWAIIPMIGAEGKVCGLYNPCFEKTKSRLAERRMLTLRELGERTASARDLKAFWQQVLGALASNPYDTPFVLLYSVYDDSESDSSSVHSSSLSGTKQCLLEGALGVPEGHPAAPSLIDLKTSSEGFTPVFREVLNTNKPLHLTVGKEVSADLFQGMEWRGFGDPVREIVCSPVHPTTGETVLGFLVMGVNPRRPYDDDYSLFIQLLSRQLATSLASVVLFEEEIRRGQRAAKLAALDRMELSEQLRDSETRFTRMAEFSPAGLFIADSAGRINFSNDTYHEISRVPRDAHSTERWIDAVLQEDQERVRTTWRKVVNDREVVTAEFRFKTPWQNRSGDRTDTWVLFSAYPETNSEGELKSVFGSIANISPQKFAESLQTQRLKEAVELKRQQENSIDITSHEMRNPLSAILQCADEISTTLGNFRASESDIIDTDLVTSSIDAAQTIALCALHQKNIVNDILLASKLDAAMLHVTPVDVQPLEVVQRALKMFQGEVVTADIKLDFVVDKSYQQLDIDWVKLDPSRVLQVLINLTGNAIKFTTTERKRTISVSVAAYKQPPSKESNPIVKFFPARGNSRVQPHGADWGNGELIYLQFAVQDSGRGLKDSEKSLLFQRFSQASPRTHVFYGGSGLGLFISRELSELQGGEIGVASEAGQGSTFAFYVTCRKSSPPQSPVDQPPIILPRQLPSFTDRVPQMPLEKPIERDFALESTSKSAKVTKKTKIQRGIHVLLVEDNLVNQRVLQRQLKTEGFHVTVANHGVEALDALRASTFWREANSLSTAIHVILMDQEMPVMDGRTCTERIRQWEKNGDLLRHVPIIAVTANARPAQIQALMDAGMDEVLSKPFRIPDLIPKIEELLEKFPR